MDGTDEHLILGLFSLAPNTVIAPHLNYSVIMVTGLAKPNKPHNAQVLPGKQHIGHATSALSGHATSVVKSA